MLKQAIKNFADKAGYVIEKKQTAPQVDPIIPHGVIEDDFRKIYEACRPYTMTTAIEMYNVYNAAQYIVKHDIPGDFVECGVWRGGSAMVAAMTLLQLGDTQRKFYLFDTYEGMPEATEHDVTHEDESVEGVMDRVGTESGWLDASIEEVRANMLSTGLAEDRLVQIKGKVEDTIPGTMPDGAVGILRLDTDFYASTYHELTHLYPRLSNHGVLIIDDYDYWKGSRKATDQYFAENRIRMFLQRMDVGRIGIKAE